MVILSLGSLRVLFPLFFAPPFPSKSPKIFSTSDFGFSMTASSVFGFGHPEYVLTSHMVGRRAYEKELLSCSYAASESGASRTLYTLTGVKFSELQTRKTMFGMGYDDEVMWKSRNQDMKMK